MIDRAAVFAICVKKEEKKRESVGAPAACASAQGGAWINRPSENRCRPAQTLKHMKKSTLSEASEGNEGAESHNANTMLLPPVKVLRPAGASGGCRCDTLDRWPDHHKATWRPTNIHTSTSSCWTAGGTWRTRTRRSFVFPLKWFWHEDSHLVWCGCR